MTSSLYKAILMISEDSYANGAREVAEFLGYVTWLSFHQVIRQAKRSARLAGWSEQEHFQPTYKRVRNGLRGHRSIEDYQLSREAFWFVVQHGDPLKRVVLFGKSVVAMQAATFDSAVRLGLSSGSRDAGYRGLYGGLTENDLRVLKGISAGEDLLNWMGPEEFADNLFRITLTEEKLRTAQVRGREQINQIHFEVGQRVRNLIINVLGGTSPEELPTPTKSIQQLEREEQQRLKMYY